LSFEQYWKSLYFTGEKECRAKIVDIFLQMGGDFNLQRWQQKMAKGMSVNSRAGRMLTLAAQTNKEKDKQLIIGECLQHTYLLI
jgi:hypothetical protein